MGSSFTTWPAQLGADENWGTGLQVFPLVRNGQPHYATYKSGQFKVFSMSATGRSTLMRTLSMVSGAQFSPSWFMKGRSHFVRTVVSSGQSQLIRLNP